MRRFMEMMKNEKVTNVFMMIKIIVMLVLLYLYLMYADLSTAPEFIYNQF
ncbi:MAG: hypothetical protein ACI4ES_05350 [Roseburia sp.]